MAVNSDVNKVIYGDQTLIDLTNDTVTADKIVEGYTAHSASGRSITGTLSDATQNSHGLMSAEDKAKLDGLSSYSFDTKPTENSNNLVTSGTVYSSLDDIITALNELSEFVHSKLGDE